MRRAGQSRRRASTQQQEHYQLLFARRKGGILPKLYKMPSSRRLMHMFLDQTVTNELLEGDMTANNPLVFSHMRFILRTCDRPEKVWKNVANFKMPATSSSITKLAADGLGRHVLTGLQNPVCC